MRRPLLYLLIFVVLLALPFAVRYLRFYSLTSAERQPLPDYEPGHMPNQVPTPSSGDFVDEPDPGRGYVLLDRAHENAFEAEEIDYLDSRLAARGVEFIPYRGEGLASSLRSASAFVVIAPLTQFDAEEVQAVLDFVERGGRLLLVGDPTRFNLNIDEDLESFSFTLDTDEVPLNSLSNAFDFVFNGDYLYNTVENEGNFRNIVLTQSELSESDLTRNIHKLAFYGTHSIGVGPNGRALLLADNNTWSSATDRPGGAAVAALSHDDRALAIGDMDFMSNPYSTVYDNGQFVAHIADFLTAPDRDFGIADFPYFLGPEVDLIYTGDPELGPDAFDEVAALQKALQSIQRELRLSETAAEDRDILYVGLYNQAEEVAHLLEGAGISLVIDPPVVASQPEEADAAGREDSESARSGDETGTRRIDSDLGSVQMSGTALLLVDDSAERRQVVALAASSEGLENTIDRFVELVPLDAGSALSDCLLQENLALCPTNIENEMVEAELESGGVPDVEEEETAEHIVEDDTGAAEGAGDFDAVDQGSIALGETVDETLAEDESHAWTFSEGPAVVNIVLQGEENLDGVLELYDPEGTLLGAADSTFAGETESLELIEIPDDGTYTIVVRDFFNDGGDYSLRIAALTPDDLGASDQGKLTLGEEGTATLEGGDIHSWTFRIEEPTTVEISLDPSPDLNGVLVLFDTDLKLVEVADNELEGGEELLEGLGLDEPGTYTVVVGAYGESGGEYALLVREVE